MQNTVNDIMNYIPVTHDQAKLLKDLGYNKTLLVLDRY
jgi:hypothetical protein